MPRPPSDERRWPAPGQIGIAVAVGLVVALFVGVLSQHHASKSTSTAATSVSVSSTVTVATVPSTPGPSPTVTVATVPSTAGTGSRTLVALTIATGSHQDTYSRTADFGGWTDVNGCQNTRAALLIRTSSVPVSFTTARDCTVATGRWVDPWSGVVTNDAGSFQIDHTVPLGNAWASGAWSWTHDRRVAYTNDLSETDHLVPILAHENEQKSDDGPDRWRPPSRGAWCRYALAWDHIKAHWQLSATRQEWSALEEMSATC